MTHSQSNIASFLSKQHLDAGLVVNEQEMDVQHIPLLWSNMIKLQPVDRVAVVLKIWQDYLGHEFSLVIETLKRQLKEVHIIKNGETYSLLYQIECDGELYYYEGPSPYSFSLNENIERYWPLLDEKLKWFYTRFQNGWYFLPSMSLGLLPSQMLFTLNEKEWSIIEEVEPTIDLHKTIAFFHNGSGGYLCLNFEQDVPRGVVWWNDEEPTVGINFWDYLDEWTKIGLEN